MKRLLPYILITLLLSAGVYLFLYHGETNELPDLRKSFDAFLGFLLGFGIITFLMVLSGKWLNNHISWQAAFGRRYFVGLLLYLVITIGISALFVLTYVSLPTSNLTFEVVFQTYDDVIYKYLVIIGILVVFYSTIDLALFSYHQYAVGQINSVKSQREVLTHQYNALKKQLSPHYLFNSLNTASSLLYRDADTAELYIRKLANSYQRILDSTTENLISLEKELNIVETYKYLMEIRYEDALKIDINLTDNQKARMLPPLSLQLLVENAVKHNLISEEKPLYIEIYSDDNDYLTIANNVNQKEFYIRTNEGLIENPEHKSTGIGLKNIKSRYAYYTRKPVKIEKHEYFKVMLPMLSKKPSFVSN